MKKYHIIFIAMLSCCLSSMAYTIADQGAWCWFADPRALHHQSRDGRINMTYIGYIDTHGNIKATQLDYNRRQTTDILVRSYFQPDDHDNPTFLVLPDQRVMVFYSRHTDEPCFYYRVSRVPGDITTLGPEHTIPTDHNTTYPSPFILSDDPDHFYLCWRGINWHPTIARLTLPDTDDNVSVDLGPYQIVQSTGARPYAKYATDGKSRIMMAYTTGHPDNESPNILYYNYIDIADMALYDVAGNRLGYVADGPMHVSKDPGYIADHPDLVVDASGCRDWVWQLALDRAGSPVIAMTRISDDKKSHNYYIARRAADGWSMSHIAYAGAHFHQSPKIEHCYSAGMAIDSRSPDLVYCSVPVDGSNGCVYEIVKYRLDPNGEIISAEAVTSNSAKNNVRPYVIAGVGDSPSSLCWMQGDYYDWIVSRERPAAYSTAIISDFAGFSDERFGPGPVAPAERAPGDYTFNPDEDFCMTVPVDIASLGRTGEVVNLGALTVSIDTARMIPVVRYKGRAYASTNRLATSDAWQQARRATDGRWEPPTPVTRFSLTLKYTDGCLETYRDGLLDQSIPLRQPARPSVFTVNHPDRRLSPYTGMTRDHWIEAARYLLEGAFSYIGCIDDEMYFPKTLDKIYPRNQYDIKVAKLEGLARTLFIAAPLLREDPDLTINGINVAEYYRHQILGFIDPSRANYQPQRPGGPSQTLLELGSVCLSLEIAKDAIWDKFSRAQQDSIAVLMRNYGEGPTIDSNWRFFNVFILSFLKEHGYSVNDAYLEQNLNSLLAMYRGEGWYNDAPAYDYYSMWAYQTYGPLWAYLFGNKQYPDIAARFTANQRDMIDNYPYMFARDGRMNMWGRSIPYRFACVSPFGVLEFAGHEGVNYGWLRRISSATLLQFMQHPDFLDEGVPTMGFYGEFAPAVQIYSCRGSVYWMGKAFFNLLLPADSEYWSARENEGPWASELRPGHVYNKFQPATNLMITNYPNCGGSEMRSWCKETVARDWQKFRSSENYNKLAYHTEFPWMADGDNGDVSMNYAVLNSRGQWEVLRLYDFVDFSDGIYRRDAVLETDPSICFRLADIPLPDGVLRVDKIIAPRAIEVHLGSYSLPRLSTDISVGRRGPAVTIGNGDYRLASVPLLGWDETYTSTPYGLHPVSDCCGVIINSANVEGEHIFVTLHLWQKGAKDIPDKLLRQVRDIDISPDLSRVTVTLSDGSTKTVKF